MAGQITYDRRTNPVLRDVTVAMPTFDDDPVVLGYALDAALEQGLTQPIIIVDMSRGIRSGLPPKPAAKRSG